MADRAAQRIDLGLIGDPSAMTFPVHAEAALREAARSSSKSRVRVNSASGRVPRERAPCDKTRMITKDIAYSVGDKTLTGYLASPGKGPGVLVCHQGMGVTEHSRERARM